MHGKKIVQTLVGDKMAHQNNNNNKKKGVNDGINQRTNQKKEKCAHHPLKIKPTDIIPVNKKNKKTPYTSFSENETSQKSQTNLTPMQKVQSFFFLRAEIDRSDGSSARVISHRCSLSVQSGQWKSQSGLLWY